MKSIITLLLVSIKSLCTLPQSPHDREVMSNNLSMLVAEEAKYSDWIEALNEPNNARHLEGSCLSDDITLVANYASPDRVFAPYVSLVVFGSKKEPSNPGCKFHTDFHLASAGEPLILSSAESEIHSALPAHLAADASRELYPDGCESSHLLTSASPPSQNTASGKSSEIQFSHEGGYYNHPVILELNATNAFGHIYYTIDGSIPSILSLEYRSPITVDHHLISNKNIYAITISPESVPYTPLESEVPKIVVIRAALINDSGELLSRVVTHSYFIQAIGQHIPQLPVMSICADSIDLFSYDSGIMVPGVHFDSNDPLWTGNYYQRGREWERSINLEFFEHKQAVINQMCGLRTHGGSSRRFQQKGFRLYARQEYGASTFGYRMFHNKEISQYKRLVLKPLSSSWSQAGIEDQVSSNLANNLNIDYVSSRPIVVYLNGEYWGIYYLQERIDDHYIKENHGAATDCIDLLDSWHGYPVTGSNAEFLSLYTFVEQSDLSIDQNYEFIEERIDVQNFIDYHVLEIFIGNYDWPANNVKLWKDRCGNNKWRWIFFDGDAAYGSSDYNSFTHALNTGSDTWPTNAMSTLFLRKLLENTTFTNQFFERFEQLLNSNFAFVNTGSLIKTTFGKINPELHNQAIRFDFPASYNYAVSQIVEIRGFLQRRPCVVSGQIASVFLRNLNTPECIPYCDALSNMVSYPNPSSTHFSVKLQSAYSTEADLQITGLNGVALYHSKIRIHQGDNNLYIPETARLRPGLHIITITADGCRYSCTIAIIE